MIRAAGVDQVAELNASGSAYAVAEVNIRYVRPARLGTTSSSSARSKRCAAFRC